MRKIIISNLLIILFGLNILLGFNGMYDINDLKANNLVFSIFICYTIIHNLYI